MSTNSTWTETGVTTKLSPRSVPDTVSRLTDLIAAKSMKLFGVSDQRLPHLPRLTDHPGIPRHPCRFRILRSDPA